VSEKMANATVYYAVAQARFNTIANMAHYVDAVQDAFRRRDFTTFETHESTVIDFDDSTQTVNSSKSPAWFFAQADRKAGFMVSQTSILFHTTHYETSADFLPKLLEGLKIVHEIVGLAHVARIGLRYLDAVLPRSGESPYAYIVPTLHGIDLRGESVLYRVHEAVFPIEAAPPATDSLLVSRVHWRKGAVAFPPDLIVYPHTLAAKDSFIAWGTGEHIVIDTDHFVSGQFPIDDAVLSAELRSLHGRSKDVFNTVITQHARDAWHVEGAP